MSRHTMHCYKRQLWGDGECECGAAHREEKKPRILVEATTVRTLVRALWDLCFSSEMKGVFMLDDIKVWPNWRVDGVYRCIECGRLTPWDKGSDNGPECDDCWWAKQPKEAQ